MGKKVGLLLGAAVFALCLITLTTALDCLLCKSTDSDSECRLGQRKYKPKLDHCEAPTAKCFALARVSINGTAKFRRGCTIEANFCDKRADIDFCKTCGSKFCNFWIMDVSAEAETFLKGQRGAISEITTRRATFSTEKLRKRRIFDDAQKDVEAESILSPGVKDGEEGPV